MTTPGPNLRSRLLAPALGIALATFAVASFGGCLVSFDGYQLADAGGSPNGTAGGGGDVTGGRGGTSSTSGGAVGLGGTSAIAGTSSGGANAGQAGRGGTSSMNGGGAGMGGALNSGGGGAAAGGVGAAGGSAGSAGTGIAGSGGTGGGPASCPVGRPGPILVEIPRAGGGIFCIDRTEVTNSDYAAFLASSPNPANQSTSCKLNSTFTPDVTTECTQYDPTNKPKVPVACVDWCDAEAYCAWAGKHLCGKIGGGTNSPADFADATKSEWYTACSHAGQYKFPYGAQGDTYNGGACVGGDSTAIRPTAVPTTSCQGGYDGLYDMSGNVSEWEDSCSASSGLSDLCLYRGGSYLDFNTIQGSSPSLQCNSGNGSTPKAASKARSTRDKEIGFRCCLDP